MRLHVLWRSWTSVVGAAITAIRVVRVLMAACEAESSSSLYVP